jgi:hypothetical protein
VLVEAAQQKQTLVKRDEFVDEVASVTCDFCDFYDFRDNFTAQE